MGELIEVLREIGLPYAYDHYAANESPEGPFIIFLLPETNHMAADGRVFHKVVRVHVELYTDTRDLGLEREVEAVFDAHGLVWVKTCVWIEAEKLFEVLYRFDLQEDT